MILSTEEAAREAIHTFHLDRPGKPTLIPLGLPTLDNELGGLGPGACGIMAAATGVGKSSTMLSAMLGSKVKVGCVSVEDGVDVLGSRLLSAVTGFDSLKIRKKDLTSEETKEICDAKMPDHMHFAFPTAGSIENVVDAVDELCQAGCKMIWTDYAQKIRGHRDDRRHEVAETFTRIQRAVAGGGAAGMVISQFRRFGADERVPQVHHLKESGDLENEARLILLGHRFMDEHGVSRIQWRVAKSTYGGEWLKWEMVRDDGGTLREVALYNPTDDF